MKRNIFLIIIIISIQYSCSKNEGILTFPETIEIKGSVVEEIEIHANGANLLIVDTVLIVQKYSNNIINVYDLENNHKPIIRFGKVGMGSREFQSPELLKQVSIVNNTPYINIYDFDRRRFSKVNLVESLNTGESSINQELVSEFDDYLNYFFYKDNDFLLATSEVQGRFIHHNYKTNKTNYIPFIPETDFEISDEIKPFVYKSSVLINADKKLIAAAPIMLGKIDFFDLSGNYVKSTLFSDPDELKNNLPLKKGNGPIKMHIIDLVSKDDLIYALNSNNTFDQYSNPELKKNNQKIQVFDWNGKAIIEYILSDGKYLSSIAYDKKNNKIYGYCRDQEPNNIIMYDLNL